MDSLLHLQRVLVALLLILQLIRFQIGPDGFVLRTPLSSTTVDFADLSRAYFVVIYGGSTPQGVGSFCVETKDGKKIDLNLRLYTIKAAVALRRTGPPRHPDRGPEPLGGQPHGQRESAEPRRGCGRNPAPDRIAEPTRDGNRVLAVNRLEVLVLSK